MTRKDYEAIARAIATVMEATQGYRNLDGDIGGQCALARLVGHLEVIFENDNPRFNSDKFAKACGL